MQSSSIHPKPMRRWRRFFLWGGAVLSLVLLAGLTAVVFVRGSESGWFGPSPQNWIRAQKSRYVFNHLYSMPEPPMSRRANAFVVRAVRGLQPGAALDIASGEGRNALYLAETGWTVTAFDVAEDGLALTRAAATSRHLPVETVEASFHNFDYGKSRWDLVILVYVSLPYDNCELLQKISESVKPGGYLLIETPLVMHQAPSAVPRIPGDLNKGELPSLWPEFDPVEYTEADEITDFFHIRVPMAHFLGRKHQATRTRNGR